MHKNRAEHSGALLLETHGQPFLHNYGTDLVENWHICCLTVQDCTVLIL